MDPTRLHHQEQAGELSVLVFRVSSLRHGPDRLLVPGANGGVGAADEAEPAERLQRLGLRLVPLKR
eukprot:scaffold159577_cov27-Tisochrysis_lutea.AAC.1